LIGITSLQNIEASLSIDYGWQRRLATGRFTDLGKLKLRCDERFTHAVAFSKKFRCLTQTKVITLNTQLHAVNACVKRSLQRSLNFPTVVRPIFTTALAALINDTQFKSGQI